MDQENRILAAVDLGSNSFHMIVAKLDHDQLRVLDKMREPVRLGAGLDQYNNLSDEARDRALRCLEKFGQRLRDFHPNDVRVVGTNTLRKARDSSAFVRSAEQALGHEIEIISGIEEARLIYEGVSHNVANDGARRLVVDIGGGSTELIVGEHFKPLVLESLYMGCVSMSDRYFPAGLITREAFQQAEVVASLEVEGVSARFLNSGWKEAVGASGTARALARVIEAEGWSDSGISLKGLKKIRKILIEVGHMDKVLLQGLKDERRPVFAGGVAIMLSIFKGLGIEQMQVSAGALREGLIYDMLGRLRNDDVRAVTIASMCRRYHVDSRHARNVERTVMALFNQVADDWGLDDYDNQLLLRWSSRLHEVGLDIAHNQYHKHGAYLVANADMPGFSRSMQKQLAFLVRGHRRKFPQTELDAMQPDDALTLKRICILLRLAVKLHHSRSREQIPEVALTVADDTLRMSFPDGWLKSHPLTREDMMREEEYLRAAGVELLVGGR